MILQRRTINLLYIFILFLFLIILKNYTFCNLFSDCSLVQENYGGDLSKYVVNYYSGNIVNYYSILAYSIFLLFHKWISFEMFLIIFQLSFYSIIFFGGLRLINNESLTKFTLFIIAVIFYPIYDGYSSFAMKQGLGMIFLFASIFFVKKLFSFSSWIFILSAILCHLVFLLFYLIFFISRYFSLNFLIYLFITSAFIYVMNINDTWYIININFLYNLDIFFIADDILSKFYSETKLRFILFSSLPLFSLAVVQFKKLLHKNKFLTDFYKFHLLYSSFIYLFLSEFYYIDRFLSLTWILYPFYFLVLMSVIKIDNQNLKEEKIP